MGYAYLLQRTVSLTPSRGTAFESLTMLMRKPRKITSLLMKFTSPCFTGRLSKTILLTHRFPAASYLAERWRDRRSTAFERITQRIGGQS